MAITTEQYLNHKFFKNITRTYRTGDVPEKAFKQNLKRLLKSLDPIAISKVVKNEKSLSVFVRDFRIKNDNILRLDLCLRMNTRTRFLKECCHFIALLHIECKPNKPSKSDSDLDEMFDMPAPHQYLPVIQQKKLLKLQTALGEFDVSKLKDTTNFKPSQLALAKFVGIVSKSKLEKFQVDMLNAFNKSTIPPTTGDFNMDLHKVDPSIAQNKNNPNLNLKKENSMKITRPVLVGNVDILTASPELLGNIIREANNQMTQMADLAVESKYYENKQNSLKEVVKLCVGQLDKDIK